MSRTLHIVIMLDHHGKVTPVVAGTRDQAQAIAEAARGQGKATAVLSGAVLFTYPPQWRTLTTQPAGAHFCGSCRHERKPWLGRRRSCVVFGVPCTTARADHDRCGPDGIRWEGKE